MHGFYVFFATTDVSRLHGARSSLTLLLAISELQNLTFFPGHMKLAAIDVRLSVDSSQ